MSNNNSPKRMGGFRFSIYWMYAIIGIILIGAAFYQDNTVVKDLNKKGGGWPQFVKYVEQGGIKEIRVISNKNIVRAEVSDTLAKKIFSKQEYKAGGSQKPLVEVGVASAESVRAAAEAWSQNGIYTGPIIYEEENDYWNGFWAFAPIILIIVFWLFMMRRMSGGGSGSGGVFSVGKAKAQLFDKDGANRVTFQDVAGLSEAKTEVAEIVQFLKDPKSYTELGGRIPKGALLVGPPGTGKTLLAKAVAGEADVPFFSLSGSDFVEMFVGVGASRVRDLFRQAKEKAPCIVFIDEIDAVGRARGRNPNMGSNDERENTLNQLLTEMDGFGSNSGVICLAATNRVDILDKALLRAGRFDRQIYVDLPDVHDRVAIFNVHLRKIKKADDLDVELLARQTAGFSGADIANVCNEAALIAARNNKKMVDFTDFNAAIDRIIGGLEKKSKITTDEEKRGISVHEAGHATVSWHLRYGDPLVKVTIVPRGKALGAAWYLPEERQLVPAQALLDKICSLMGGRAAEDLFIGQVATGALNDLERATKIAYSLVVYYGMSDKIPNISYYDSTGQDYGFSKPYSEERSKVIDQEVSRILNEQYERAKDILRKYAEGHKKLADLLMEKEVIFTADVEDIFGKRPWTSRADEIMALDEAAKHKALTPPPYNPDKPADPEGPNDPKDPNDSKDPKDPKE